MKTALRLSFRPSLVTIVSTVFSCWVFYPLVSFGQFNLICDSCYAPGQPVHCDTKTTLSANVCDPPGAAIQQCVRIAIEGLEYDECPTPYKESWHSYPWLSTIIEQVIGQTGQDCKNDRQKDCVIQKKCLCDWLQNPNNPNQMLLACVDSNQIHGTRSFQEWFPTGDSCPGTK